MPIKNAFEKMRDRQKINKKIKESGLWVESIRITMKNIYHLLVELVVVFGQLIRTLSFLIWTCKVPLIFIVGILCWYYTVMTYQDLYSDLKKPLIIYEITNTEKTQESEGGDQGNDPVNDNGSEATEEQEKKEVVFRYYGTTEEVTIRRVARENGFEDDDLLVRIAMCESGDPKVGWINPFAKNGARRGAFQYLEGTWEEGASQTGNDWSLDDRYDLEKSTRMAIFHISGGYVSKWSESQNCWKK